MSLAHRPSPVADPAIRDSIAPPPLALELHFRDERAALARLERVLWPHGPICPHCDARGRIGAVTGRGARAGLKYCCDCRKQFRVTLGTPFEHSHVPAHKWLQACRLLAAAQAGVNAHRLHFLLDVSYKTALHISRSLEQAAAARLPGAAGERRAEAGSGTAALAELRRLAGDSEGWFDRLLGWLLQPVSEAVWQEP